LVCVASRLSKQHYVERENICWIGIRTVCPSGDTCLTTDS